MLIDENGNVGIGTNTPVAKLDINAGTAPGFRLDDGTPTNDAGKVLTSDTNGVGSWATMFPNFQTAQVVFSSATRTFGTGNNATAQANAHNVGVGTASLAAGSTVPRFTVDNASGIFIVPKGKYFVYFSGDISSAEYAYEMLRRVSDTAALLTTIVSERADNFTMMSVDADTQMYLAVGGIVGSNPAPEYYLTQDRYEAGLISSFQITFMKYAE
jgi:hypothetical protein